MLPFILGIIGCVYQLPEKQERLDRKLPSYSS